MFQVSQKTARTSDVHNDLSLDLGSRGRENLCIVYLEAIDPLAAT